MRYLVLVLLNLPIILLAFVNILTQYKMHKITKTRFRHQMIWWSALLVILVSSFPFYNYLVDKPIFDSKALSMFDIVQTTTIIFLLYATNYQRQHIERTEKIVRDLHQEISIKLADQAADHKQSK
jgi:hypothetical protein